jgi:DNA-binding NarL/FixJ family response regulator
VGTRPRSPRTRAGAAGVRVVTEQKPDVVLLDVRMPGMDGLEAARRILEAGLPTRVVVLTTFDEDEYVAAALRAGVSGFLLKVAPPEDLVTAVRTVAARVQAVAFAYESGLVTPGR